MPESGVRQLKAIMFTDIKGFSAMMGKDEERTMRLVREHREIVRATLPDHSGHEHETIGDAFVVLFDSAVNAVQCAADIQGKFRARNAELPAEEQVWIRVGIHVGDIIVHEEGDIYGDGVNIAARVEPLAEPGGICITQDVFLQVQKKVGLRAVSIGKQELKNITEAPEIYRLLLEGDAAPEGEMLAGPDGKPEWPRAPLWKSVLWFVITVPMAVSTLIAALSAEGSRGLLTSFALSEDLPQLVGLILAVVISGGMVLASVMLQRFWATGRWSRWLHGPHFVVFPLIGLLLILYHYLQLQGQMASYLTSLKSYTVITEAQASQMSGLIAETTSRFLNSVALDQMLICFLALMILLACVFLRPVQGRTKPSWKRWLIIPAALLVVVALEVVAGGLMSNYGPWRFILFFSWILVAVPLLRLRAPEIADIHLGGQIMRAGVITMLAMCGMSIVMGYIGAFMTLSAATPALREAAWSEVTPIIYDTFTVIIIALVVFFVGLAAVRWRVLPISSGRKGALKRVLFTGGVAVLAGAPIIIMPDAMALWGQQWLPGKLKQMHPASIQPRDPPTFYLDRQPQTLHLGGHGLHRAITGEERFEEASLIAALVGGEECRDSLLSSLKPEDEATPAVCLTAIEARLTCESIGLRLPTPAEWQSALAAVPVDPPGDYDKPFSRGPFAEWTMRTVHGTPTFEIMGRGGIPGAPERLDPDRFSEKVGFRCAFSFEPPPEGAAAAAKEEEAATPATVAAKPSSAARTKKLEIPGKLFIDRIAASDDHAGLSQAVAAVLARKLDDHYASGVLTFAEAGEAATSAVEGETGDARPKRLAGKLDAGTVLSGELVALGDDVWVNLAFYDARQDRITNRLSQRSAPSPEQVVAAVERGLEGILTFSVEEDRPSKELIRALIQSKIGIIAYCYEKALEDTPDLGGRLVVGFTISSEGVFQRPTMVEDATTLKSPAINACVLDAIDGLQTGFSFTGETSVKYPFDFAPPAGTEKR